MRTSWTTGSGGHGRTGKRDDFQVKSEKWTFGLGSLWGRSGFGGPSVIHFSLQGNGAKLHRIWSEGRGRSRAEGKEGRDDRWRPRSKTAGNGGSSIEKAGRQGATWWRCTWAFVLSSTTAMSISPRTWRTSTCSWRRTSNLNVHFSPGNREEKDLICAR